MKKIISTLLIILLIALPLSSCKKQLNRYQAEFLELFDTATIILGYSYEEDEFMKKAELLKEELTRYHKLYDIYNEYEGLVNLKIINDLAGTGPVKVDKEIIDLLVFSKQIYEITEGKVNIAMGSVLSIWHDYRTKGIRDSEHAELPPMNMLLSANEHTDINNLIIDEENMAVELKDPYMSLDVGAIAKGFAVERLAEYAKTIGFNDGLISVGGNLRALGLKGEKQELWNLGIQNPDLESAKTDLFILKGTDISLVTSGDYQRYYTVDGKQYHHIIDPETLMPSTKFKSVTIITKDSGFADGLSTGVYLMDYEQGKALIESIKDTEALWVFYDGSVKYTTGFEAMIK